MKQIDYYHFDTLPSTNTFVKENLSLFSPDHLSVVTADVQTKGRGRRERSWKSERGNLFMTLAFATKMKEKGSLGIQLSIACCEALKEFNPKIKWPNDILIGGKKIAGILGETDGDWVILGIGVNLNAKVEVENAISLYELTGKKTPLKEFKEELAERFPGDLKLQSHYSMHKVGDKIMDGTFLRFGKSGEIRLLVHGVERSLFSGEIA